MGDKIWGHDPYKSMTCPHCHQGVHAELVEIRLFTSVYKCPNCGQPIRRDTIAEYVRKIGLFWYDKTH